MTFSLDDLLKTPSRTDWIKASSFAEADLARMDREDPDLAGVEDIDWSKAEIVNYSAKQSISIRLDPDVLAFFKAGGKGYQSRINAVLRSYVSAKRKA